MVSGYPLSAKRRIEIERITPMEEGMAWCVVFIQGGQEWRHGYVDVEDAAKEIEEWLMQRQPNRQLAGSKV